MKTRITLLLLLAICMSNYAQTTFKLDSIYQYTWDVPMNDWKHNTHDLYTYDNGGVKETNLLRLTLSGSIWENFYQYNKAYNGNNDMTESILQNWDGAMWLNGSRDSYTYNVDNLVESFTYAIYSMGNWLTFNQNFYTYDVLFNLVEDLSKELDFITMTMVNDQRKTYDFTVNQKNYEIVENWFNPTTTWDKDEKKDYSYNTNNDVSLVEVSAWGVVSMMWSDPYKQSILTYNTDDQIEEILEQTYGSGMWINTSRIQTTYTDGKPTIMTLQEWNSGTMMWDNATRQLRTFDVNGNETELIFQNWDSGMNDWVGFLRQVKFWDPADPLLDRNEVSLSNEISIYPNPTKRDININSKEEIEQVQLFDMTGKQVYVIQNAERLSLDHLQSGLYYLKVLSNQRSKTFKIIKQ